jgi:hypothetical protein
MSRGHGWVQRGVLDALICSKGHGLTVDELFAAIFPDVDIGEKHRQGVRRALRKLRSSGDLQLIRKGKLNVRGWRYIVRSVVA